MKERIDKVLVDRGLVQSRQRACAFIMEGKVYLGDVPVTKAGTLVGDTESITVRGDDIPFVSRGGLKLMAAIEHFKVDVEGKAAMDVGASTGGFTDCLLKLGARVVYAVDVGYGQFDWRLRSDPRVVLFERTNIRYMETDKVPDKIDLAVIDVSFISLGKVMPRVMDFLAPLGEVVALVKPQFEVGRADVGKGGIVRDEAKRTQAVERVREELIAMGFDCMGLMDSPITGQKGNMEYLIYLKRVE